MNAARSFLIAMVLFVVIALFSEAEFTFLFMMLAVLCAGLWNHEVRKQVALEDALHRAR